MISLISLLEIINILVPYPNIFLWIAAPVTDTVAVNPNGIKTPLANGGSIRFSLKTIQFLVMNRKIYQKILLVVLFSAIEFLAILY